MNKFEIEQYKTIKALDTAEGEKYKNNLYKTRIENMKYMASQGMTYYFYLRNLNDKFYTRYIYGCREMVLIVCICGKVVSGKKCREHAYSVEHMNAMVSKYTQRAEFKKKRYEYTARRNWRKLAILYKLYAQPCRKRVIAHLGAYYGY